MTAIIIIFSILAIFAYSQYSFGIAVVFTFIVMISVLVKITKSQGTASKANKTRKVSNQDELMNRILSLVQNEGGVWHIEVHPSSFDVYGKNGRLLRFGNLSELGYDRIDLDGNVQNNLKSAAESRGYLFWTDKVYYNVGTEHTRYNKRYYTTGENYKNFTGTVHICTREFYTRYKPEMR